MPNDPGDHEDTALHSSCPERCGVCPRDSCIYIPKPPWGWIIWVAFLGATAVIIPQETIDTVRPWNARIPGRFRTINIRTTNGTNQNVSYYDFPWINDQSTVFHENRSEYVNRDLLWAVNFPMVVFIREVTGVYLHKRGYPFWYADFLTFWEAYAGGFAVTAWTTKILKVFTSQPRPDFFSRCDLSLDNIKQTITCNPRYGITNDLNKGWRSFPSGHSSYVAFCTTLLSLWLSGKMSSLFMPSCNCRPCGRDCVIYAAPMKKLYCFLPMTMALFVGASRIPDLLHHPADFSFGFVLGMFFAVVFYTAYYPFPLGYEYYNDTPWRVILSHPDFSQLRQLFAPLEKMHRFSTPTDTARGGVEMQVNGAGSGARHLSSE